MTGYIFDHRKELESDVWLLPPMYHRVWQWIKYKVNHSEARIPNKDGTYTVIKPGQHATSYRNIAKGVGYYEGLKWKEPNPKTVKVILDWLQSQGMISVEGNTLGTVVTIANWDLYQKDLSKGNAEVTPKKHLLDTNKKNKKELKNEEDKTLVRFDEFWSVYPKKQSKEKAASSFSKLNDLEIDLIIEDVKSKSKTVDWTKEGGKYIPMPATYLNQRRWEDSISIPKPVERTKEDQFKLAADMRKGIPVEYNPFNKGV
jgi:hypothetical protein